MIRRSLIARSPGLEPPPREADAIRGRVLNGGSYSQAAVLEEGQTGTNAQLLTVRHMAGTLMPSGNMGTLCLRLLSGRFGQILRTSKAS